MSSISFANPYLLLIAIPLLMLVIIPFFIAIRKGSFNKHNIGALVCHTIIVILITLSAAGMKVRRVITETEVIVLADVSYSSSDNYDTIDEYITDLSKNLPDNSKLGIVAFAKNQEVLVPLGGKKKSVSESNVDDTQTDIAGALRYASTLFSNNSIKRIVLISDGKETNSGSISALIEDLTSQDIYIDAIYLDNNLKDTDNEIQISNVTLASSTYLNKEEYASVIIESNRDSRATITLYKNNEVISSNVEQLASGKNTINVEIPTDEAGDMSYTLKLTPFNEGNNTSYDTSELNNVYTFSQTVRESINVLFFSDYESDLATFKNLYSGEEYNITAYIDTNDVPYSIEELCEYDQIVFSNVNVSNFKNADSFVTNLEIAVSEFGKSVITIGNTHIQNGETDSVLKSFGQILPVKFDNLDNTKRLYTILLDISKSMNQIEHFLMAKDSACSIIDMLTENDDFCVITFYGDVEIAYGIGNATPENKETAKQIVRDLVAKQATSIGAGLKRVYDFTHSLNYQKKECLLISDGETYGLDQTNVADYATMLGQANIHVNVVYTADHDYDPEKALLVTVANNSGGKYYQVHDRDTASKLITDTIADEVTENLKAGDFAVSVKKPKDDLVAGIGHLENVGEFYTSINKTTATMVISLTEKYTEYPVYSKWSYGNGSVSCFTINISSSGFSSWAKESSNGNAVMKNILPSTLPSEGIYTPFDIDLELNGTKTDVLVNVPDSSGNATVTLTVTKPDNSKEELIMTFDSENYISEIETDLVGKYTIKLNYTYGYNSYETTKTFDISYPDEYNRFAKYDSSNLYTMVNHNATVSEDGKLSISNEGIEVSTYNYEFALLFFIISLALFVSDVFIRKIRWQDIKNLFVKTKRRGEK